jgi:hypothetical protein
VAPGSGGACVAVWWVLGAGEGAVFLRITTNLLKRRCVVGRIATNLTNRRDGLGFNIHRCPP